jgi:hypothetical protein
MPSPHCRCSDGTCKKLPVEPVPSSGGISIRRSVGANGANDPQDSKTIQDALNRVSVSQGGADPKLAVDGLPWGNTVAAIRKFQTNQALVADGRVDPNGPTINRLNVLLATGPVISSAPIGVTPATMASLYSGVLPEVRLCVRAAEATLLLAWPELLFGSGTLVGKNALALVNLHFAISQNLAWQIDFIMIQRIFRNMNALLNRNLSNVEHTFEAFQGTVSATDLVTTRGNEVAIAFSDGPSDGPPTSIKTLDGKRIILEIDKIYILPAFQFQPLDAHIVTIIHEMGHYFGGQDNAPDEIKDTARGWRDQMTSLTPAQKARNAECYANFAFEAQWRRPPLTIPS